MVVLILGFDAESTGLSVKEDRITEIGAILWDTVTQEPVEIYSTFVKAEKEIPDEVIELNGITKDRLDRHGVPLHFAMFALEYYFNKSKFIIAHNGSLFDRPLFYEELNRCSQHVDNIESFNKHWIDTSTDIPYPSHITTRKLSYLASEHGFVNPFPHRAFSDVLTMLTILSNYNFDEVVALSLQSSYEVVAQVSFHDREKAKSKGFRWSSERKLWIKVVKESFLAEETKSLDFGVSISPLS